MGSGNQSRGREMGVCITKKIYNFWVFNEFRFPIHFIKAPELTKITNYNPALVDRQPCLAGTCTCLFTIIFELHLGTKSILRGEYIYMLDTNIRVVTRHIAFYYLIKSNTRDECRAGRPEMEPYKFSIDSINRLATAIWEVLFCQIWLMRYRNLIRVDYFVCIELSFRVQTTFYVSLRESVMGPGQGWPIRFYGPWVPWVHWLVVWSLSSLVPEFTGRGFTGPSPWSLSLVPDPWIDWSLVPDAWSQAGM